MSQDNVYFIPQAFDGLARFQKQSPADIARMSPENQPLWHALEQAVADVDEVQADIRNLEKAEHAKIGEMSRQLELIERVLPKWSFHDEWLKTVVGKPARVIPEDQLKRRAAEQAKHDAMAVDLDTIRDNLRATREALPTARGAQAEAWAAWKRANPPKGSNAAIKDYLASETARKQRNIDQGRHPLDDGNQTARRIPSMLDAHLAGGKGSPAIRSSRQANRGAFTADKRNQVVKAPSER